MMKKMLERARVRLIHRLGGMDREKIDLESRPLIQYRQFPVIRELPILYQGSGGNHAGGIQGVPGAAGAHAGPKAGERKAGQV